MSVWENPLELLVLDDGTVDHSLPPGRYFAVPAADILAEVNRLSAEASEAAAEHRRGLALALHAEAQGMLMALHLGGAAR